jgi:ubiquinone/menaquinone biosynthesis C-methylase UbiE
MSNPLTRFSSRVDDYVKYRPGYPSGVLDVLAADCGLTENSTIADVGSGTGMLSELFLRNGNRVIGVEPNSAMRQAAEEFLSHFPNFTSLDGAAEATTLADNSVDFVVAAQAFHWFEQVSAKREFARVLKTGGWAVLIWNERRLDATPFLREYEKLLVQYGTDYGSVRHENVSGQIAEFFAPESFRLETLENVQRFDWDGLRGRTRSSSYTPEPGTPNFEPLFAGLAEIFKAQQREGLVEFSYDTRIYYGRLSATAELDSGKQIQNRGQ